MIIESDEPSLTVISLDAYRIERYTRMCSHTHRVIDTTARTVTCKECAAVLDPFHELVEIAADHARVVMRYADLKIKITESTARLAALKAEEANARQRVRRLSLKLP